MDTTRLQALLCTTVPGEDLRRTELLGVPSRHWQQVAEGMTVREAIERLLVLIPAEPAPESVQLVDAARAKQIRSNLAAKAILMTLVRAAADVPEGQAISPDKTGL